MSVGVQTDAPNAADSDTEDRAGTLALAAPTLTPGRRRRRLRPAARVVSKVRRASEVRS